MHPKAVQNRGKLEEVKAKLNGELKKEMENLKAEHSVILSKEKVLQETVTGFENDALSTNKKELEFSIMERNVNLNKNLYNTLLSKIKETNMVDDLGTSNIKIVEKAMIPMKPNAANKKRKVMVGILMGLILGYGIALFIEYIDRTIRTEDDVQRYLKLPVLSVVPKIDDDLKLLEDENKVRDRRRGRERRSAKGKKLKV